MEVGIDVLFFLYLFMNGNINIAMGWSLEHLRPIPVDT